MINVYGPNTVAVQRIIERLLVMQAWESRMFLPMFGDNTWKMSRNVERSAAYEESYIMALRAGRYGAWEAARYASIWAIRGAEVLTIGERSGPFPSDRWACQKEFWSAARIMGWEAIAGLIVRDLITEKQFNLLVGPWVALMGRPWE